MPSTPVVLAVIGFAILVVVGLVLLTGEANKPAVSGEGAATKLTPDGFPYEGDENAPVTIDIYSDYGCSHCKDFALETEPLIEQNYVATGKVKLVWHYFGFSAETQVVAAAAVCAAEQNNYAQFNRTLFANQATLTTGNLASWASQVGLDMTAFNKCLQSSDSKIKVQKSTNLAYAAGVNATPTFFINGEKIEGALPFEDFSAKIEQALAGANP